MPRIPHCLIRYVAIDNCLQRGRRRTIDEIVNRCNTCLQEFTEREETISVRAVREDLSILRNFFGAPIECKDGMYGYSNPYKLSFPTDPNYFSFGAMRSGITERHFMSPIKNLSNLEHDDLLEETKWQRLVLNLKKLELKIEDEFNEIDEA